MSNQTTHKETSRPAQGRQPGGGRRSGSSRNRNRNRNRNRGGGGGSRNRGGQGRQPRRRPEPKPVPLTWWQKFLKAIGLYDPTKRSSPSRVPKPAPQQEKAGGGKPKRKPKQGERKAGKPRQAPPKPEDVDTRRLYLGNLSYEATEYELEDLFKGVGPVRSIEIVYNRNTHKSKGYGFVEMRTIEDAKRAVEILHDQPFMGRQLLVSPAKSKGPKDGDQDSEQERES